MGTADRPEVAIVGAGIVGLACAHALRGHGIHATVFDPAPGSGQSAGPTRIFRHQHADPSLVACAAEARREWDAWASELGAGLIVGNGSLFAAAPEVVASREKALRDNSIPVELVEPGAQRRRLSILEPATELALFDARGGTIDARETLARLLGRLRDQLDDDSVLACSERDGRAALLTTGGPRAFDHVVLATGAATPSLAARIGIAIATWERLHVRLDYPVARRAGAPGACWQDRSGAFGERVYAVPTPDGRTYSIGLVDASDDLERDPSQLLDDGAHLERIVKRTNAYVERALPGLDPGPSGYRLCRSTSLVGADGDDFRFWSSGPFLAVAGGNLYKMAPLIGRHVATAIVDRVPLPRPAARPPDPGPCSR
jgi:sarcosine oxidase